MGSKLFTHFFFQTNFVENNFFGQSFRTQSFLRPVFASNAFWFLAKFFVSFCKLNFYDQISSGSTFFNSIFRGQFSSLADFFRDYSILVEKHKSVNKIAPKTFGPRNIEQKRLVENNWLKLLGRGRQERFCPRAPKHHGTPLLPGHTRTDKTLRLSLVQSLD